MQFSCFDFRFATMNCTNSDYVDRFQRQNQFNRLRSLTQLRHFEFVFFFWSFLLRRREFLPWMSLHAVINNMMFVLVDMKMIGFSRSVFLLEIDNDDNYSHATATTTTTAIDRIVFDVRMPLLIPYYFSSSVTSLSLRVYQMVNSNAKSSREK